MPAPNGTQWGAIAGSYGRIGIYLNLNESATAVTPEIQVWFWSKYSVSDSTNNLYYNHTNTASSATTNIGSTNIKTTVESGDGWSTSNQVLLKTYSGVAYTKTTAAQTRYIYAKLADVDRVGSPMLASISYTIPSLASYTVTYNANGGTGAPGSQTKWYGKSLTLSSAKPTRTGYTFQGWATSATATTAAYSAGGAYTANAKVTLYAVWKPNSYTVTYNANGGTGAPSNQTKLHGQNLTLSSTRPVLDGWYTFKGWATSKSGEVVYMPGDTYTANASVTLYAVWALGYTKPRVYNLTVTRCDSSGTEKEEGTHALIKFNYVCDRTLVSITVAWQSANSGRSSNTCTPTAQSGVFNQIVGGALGTENTYTFDIQVKDEAGDTTFATTLTGTKYPIDFLAGGNGVAFGKPAELEETAEFAFDAKFNKPVYGKALGMDRLPEIPANSDLNNYMEPGCYAVRSNAASETIANIPVERAGRLEVWSSTGEGVRSAQWSYLRQRFIPYNESNAVWERDISRSADNVWRYYDWWRSSLTPAASEKVYAKAAMTIALSATKTLGVAEAYTKIPFDTSVLSTSPRLTMSDNSIRIGADIQYVKVSGQALIGCGNTDGLRHVRIRKVSGGTTTNISWVTVYGMANRQTICPLTPMIVAVKEGDLLNMVFYTTNSADSNSAGSSGNGWQSYLTVEEL